MNVLDDLVGFVVWLRKKGLDISKMDPAELRKHAADYWDMQHGED